MSEPIPVQPDASVNADNKTLPPNTTQGVNDMDCVKAELPCASEVSLQATSNALHGANERMGLAGLDAIGKVGDAVCDSSRDINDNVNRSAVEGMKTTERAADIVSNSVERFGLAGVEATERNGEQNLGATHGAERSVSKAVSDSYAGMSYAAREILQAQCEGVKDVLLQNSNQHAMLQDKICESSKDVLLHKRTRRP